MRYVFGAVSVFRTGDVEFRKVDKEVSLTRWRSAGKSKVKGAVLKAGLTTIASHPANQRCSTGSDLPM